MILYIKPTTGEQHPLDPAYIFNKCGSSLRLLEEDCYEVDDLSIDQLITLRNCLSELGFGLDEVRGLKLVDHIKFVILSYVEKDQLGSLHINVSSFLSDQLNRDYTYLSNLFSQVEGTTIEKYIIQKKIDRVKWMIQNKNYSLKEISFKLGYSSYAHLSTQFKKITGVTPTAFKRLSENGRIIDINN